MPPTGSANLNRQLPPDTPTMAETRVAPGDPTLHARLHQAVEGEVRFDAFTRGLYATDASHYQIEPLGVVFPRSIGDVEAGRPSAVRPSVARSSSIRAGT